MKDNELCYAS